ncbi:DUF3108 domain-containing protein [Paludibacter sp.]|uniref:DUF3108 domain-containing protein n=1 Tax=Paludibacter sp. TaxID=1898105 RepID=UPI00135348C3|nr:DUF3108 domain-containing protein [Paludibacter sp.]MTK53951.1 DUF3108 domain-containing protein [Paludibacter sp.]
MSHTMPRYSFFSKLILLCFFITFANTAFSQKSFAPGEVLTYKAYYHWGVLWLPAASITLKVLPNENPNFLTIKANGISFKRYDLFFKVRENFESTIFKNTLLPIEARRNAVEGSYSAQEHYRFNDSANTIDYNISVNEGKTKNAGKIEKADGYFDMLSAAYYMREYDFSKLKLNQKIRVNTIINGKIYPIEIQYVGNETCKDNNNKSYMCAKFAASTVPGTIFKGNEKISIWMSLDSAKIPVKVTSKLKIGEVNVELTGASGIK